MKKAMQKLLLAVLSMTLLLSVSLVAYAANGNALKTLKVTPLNGKKTILYTNGEIGFDPGVSGATVVESPVSAEFAVTAIAVSGGNGQYIATTSDRTIASVEKLSQDVTDPDYYKIRVTAGAKSGKAVITLTDKYNLKKKRKFTVTVKTLAEEICFGNAVNGDQVELVKGGKLSLGATVGSATNKKLKYTIVSQQIENANGEYVDAAKIVKVDGKGNVTGLNAGKAVIRVSAQDQYYLYGGKKIAGGYNELVEVFVSDRGVASVNLLNPAQNGKGKYDVVQLKTNVTSDKHKLQLSAEAYNASGDLVDEGVTYVSSKPAVATVDANGLITAVSNGTTKITVAAADGAKLKNKTVLTVKVTTDIERINIPNDELVVFVGKNTKLGATIDKNVTKMKLVYAAPLCYDTEGNQIALDPQNKNKQNTISVSKSGVIKGLREGSATFIVSSKDGAVSRKVYVTVVNPVKKFTATVPSYTKKGLNTAAKNTTLYLNGSIDGEDDGENESFDFCQITTTIVNSAGKTLDPEDAKVTYTSSNPTVAEVTRDGQILAVGAGKATITVATNDGSKKKAKIAVKVVRKVDHITVTNATGGELYVVNNTSVVLKAVTNSSASKKTVGFSFIPEEGYAGNVTVKGNKLTVKGLSNTPDEKVGVLVATAKDATVYPKQKGCSTYVDVYVASGDEAVTEDMLQIDTVCGGDGLSVKIGEKNTELTDGIRIPAYVTNRELIWTSSNKAVATVDNTGMVTGKKEGKTVITVTAKSSGVKSSIPVRVGKSDQAVRKDVDDKIDFVVKAENYDWVGMKPTFDKKKAEINVRVNNPYVDAQDADIRADLEQVVSTFEHAFLDTSFNGLLIVDETNGDVVTIYRTGSTVQVAKNWETISGEKGVSDAKEVAKLLLGDKTKGSDWNGHTLDIMLMLQDSAVDYTPLDYLAGYRVNIFAEDQDVDSLVDQRIRDALKNFKNDRATTGISEINYNAKTNTAIVNISDGSVKISDLDATLRSEATTVFKSVFAEAAQVTVEVQGLYGLSEEESRQTFVRKDTTDVDAAVEQLFDKLNAKMASKITNLSGLKDVTLRAKATYRFGDTENTAEYYVTFVQIPDVIGSTDGLDKSVPETDVSGADAVVSEAFIQ
ncbi:MAG: Ig-like domain-containing protein [Lachnospiraceae bacterium]|nr:Ig-like domain-containing protein [Lachnospiraceae bacterium]